MEIVFEASHTHLYPGHEGKVAGTESVSSIPADTTCRVDFADGSVTFGSLTRAGGNWTLDTGPYTTAAGTDMPAKRWRVDIRQESHGLTFRVRRKLPA